MTRYVLAQNITIPAGTELDYAPSKTERCDKHGRPAMVSGLPAHFVEAVVGPTDDTVFTWTMHIDDALEAGLIREAV